MNLRPLIPCAAAAMLCALLLRAQSPNGEIRLEVKDSSGAAMQSSGRITNAAAQVSRNFQTDAQGRYIFQSLPYGKYRLELSQSGFATQVVSIDVQSAAAVSRSVTLAVAVTGSRIDVVGTTPLPGVNLTKDQIASPTQTATEADVANSGALDLGDLMNRRLNGVYLNEMQANPFQPDVNFRGYTASPLLGTPEGISVYLDGVRQNQPFGDVVSWDLIPNNAISEITLMAGSDPVFGLNTLGGALSVQTKNGVTNPGLGGKLTYGSSGRKALQAQEGGGKATGFNWFLSANAFHESGWRLDSPSDVRQGFGRFGRRTDKTDLALTASYAYNTLIGNGLQDYRLLQRSYASVYSIPDSTADRSPSFNFIGRHTFNDKLTFSGNAWFRNIRTEGINANLNTSSFGESVYQPGAADIAALTAAGYTGFPTSGANSSNTPFPKWRCIAQALEHNEPNEKCDALTVYSKESQNEFGFSGQFSWLTDTRAGRNQFTAGANFDHGTVNFTQNTVYGYLNPNYTVTSVSAWQDGSTNEDGTPVDTRVSLHGTTPNWSLFAADTLTIARTLNLTLSGRFNQFRISNEDRINPVAGPGSLDGDYVFNRFNPAVGLTWSPVSALNFYGSYTQGSRAPTAIELGCADPANPCSLPNALASDPPLKQVSTGTWEAGVRGHPEVRWISGLSWSLNSFRAENRNDILFVSSVQTGEGYFRNFAKTRREGFDTDLNGRIRRATWGVDYTYLEATYQSTETVDGSGNNTSDTALSGFPGLDGNIYIHPGNRIPLIPKQLGKAYIDVQATKKLLFDFDEVAVSSSYARGNENNAYQSDGKYYLGPGVSPGYAVTNFLARYDVTRRLQLAAQVDNLFNRHYYSAAQLANTGLTAQGNFIARPFTAYGAGPQSGNYPLQSVTFFTPGAPRRAWVELLVKF